MSKKKITDPSVGDGNIDVLPLSRKQKFFGFVNEKWKKYAYLGIGGALAAAVVFLIYMIVTGGLHPAGNGTTLILDLNSQYIYFFSALRNAVYGDGELLYSFSRSMGGEFIGIYAYYLASPLSYLVCLFPADRMQEFALVLMMLKAALCSVTMGYFLHKHSQKLNKLTTVAFSLMYALCAYCVVYQTNTMWIDAAIWLPLLTLGIEALVQHGKYKLFVISLAMTVASNYYIGYMCCIYVLLYYLYFTFAHKNDGIANPRCESRHFLKSTFRMAIFSILAICMAALIILGAYYSLSFGKNDFSDPRYDLETRITFFDVIFKLFPGSYDTVRPANFVFPISETDTFEIATGGFPFIYCGIFTLMLMPAFFFSKRFSVREKIASASLIGIFILSFVLTTLDIVWHGFQNPQWLNNRYSFMLCFFMIFLAFKAFENIDEYFIKQGVIISSLFFGAFALIIQKMAPQINSDIQSVNPEFKLGSFEFALFAVGMIVVYLFMIALIRNIKSKTLVSAFLLGIIVVELLLNGISNTADFADDVAFSTYSKYDQFQELMYPIVETVQDNDDSFYRMEKTAYRKPNDNMQFGIRGLSNSTSTLNAASIQTLNQMGYAGRAQWTIYLGGNAVNDSLLGLKYIITDRDLSEFYGEPVYTAEDFAKHEGVSVNKLTQMTLADNSKYENYHGKSASDFVVYKNPYALSIAFAADHDVIDFNMKMYNQYINKKLEPKKYEELQNSGGYANPFDRLNALYTAILGTDETVEIFKPATQTAITYTSDITHTVVNSSQPGALSHLKYSGEGGSVTFNYSVPVGKTLYLYFPAYYTREVALSASMPIADGTTNFGSNVSTNPTLRIVELGASDKEEYSVTASLTKGDDLFYVINQESYVYYVDTELLAQVTKEIQKNQLVIEEYTESSFKGHISTSKKNQLILTTIPYDEGWQITVDGKKVDIIDAVDTTPGKDGGGAFVAFEIPSSGYHSVSIVYRPKYLPIGAFISVTAILVFVSLVVFEKKLMRISLYRKIFYIEDNSILEEPVSKKGKVYSNNKSQRKD
ncbi:MAG: hypothetical protein E7667_00800 [Ruminococcaceae bacterium]|nr:hypothetical protein [Oscillospiraceae bacterium]